MARVPLVDPEDPGTSLEMAAQLRSRTSPDGSLHNVVRALANNVDAMGVLTAISKLYQSERLSEAQHQLAYLTASMINSCHY